MRGERGPRRADSRRGAAGGGHGCRACGGAVGGGPPAPNQRLHRTPGSLVALGRRTRYRSLGPVKRSVRPMETQRMKYLLTVTSIVVL